VAFAKAFLYAASAASCAFQTRLWADMAANHTGSEPFTHVYTASIGGMHWPWSRANATPPMLSRSAWHTIAPPPPSTPSGP